MGGEVLSGNIDELKSGDAIDLKLPLIAGEKSQTFLEQENDDERENDDGQSGVGCEEVLDRPLVRETPLLEAVGRSIG